MQGIFPQLNYLQNSPFSQILTPSKPFIRKQNPFRSSLSPHKLNNKKFFYSVRNKSKKKIEQTKASKIQLQNQIHKQQLLVTSKKSDLNSIIIAQCEKMFEERQSIVLPTLQMRKSNDNNFRIQAEQKKINDRILLGLSDFKRKSNILGNIDLVQTIRTDNPQNIGTIKWASTKIQKNAYEPQIKRSIVQYPKLNRNRSIRGTPQSEYNIKAAQQAEQSPVKMKQIKSLAKFVQKIQVKTQVKFKKGYLAYQSQQSISYWEKLKKIQNQVPRIKSINSKLITAKVYYALDVETLQPVVACNQTNSIQIASLSKIMTCYLSIMICKKYKVDIKNCVYRVPDRISQTPGTSAELQAGDVLTVEDLLYALMLPSGNDASICLAETMGKVLQKNKTKQQKKPFYDMFIEKMNYFSKELGLCQEWNNSSGLSANPNFSTAQAIVLLSALAIKNELFRKIVQTKQYEIQIKNDRYGLVKKQIWKNTNKLLQKGWQGVKTGTTQTAGHCLISKNKNLLIGVFDCSTLNRRFVDCTKLYQYISNHQLDNINSL